MSRGETAIQQDSGASRLPPLETLEVQTGADPSAAVIWLHGLGADGHDFEPVVPHLLWPGAPALRFVFPHAPVRPVTINGGMRMRAWYDILALDSDRGHDAGGILESMQGVAQLVEREQRRGIEPARVVLAGFSQGGAIAIQLALRYPQRLAGLVALSAYLLNAQRLEAETHPLNRALPAFIGHGRQDPMVPLGMGEIAARELRRLGCEVEWQSYPIAHEVSAEEIGHVAAWLRRRLGGVT